MKKTRNKNTPLRLHLLGGAIAFASGLAVRPFSEAAHYIITLCALMICLYAIYRYFRG